MSYLKLSITVVAVFCAGHFTLRQAMAQQQFSGSTQRELQWSGSNGFDLRGRAVNVDGRPIDRYGTSVDDFWWPSRRYQVPMHAAGGLYSPAYSTGSYYPSGIGGYSDRINGYSTVTGYSPAYGSGTGTNYISPPRTVIVGGVYPSRTVMNNATRGTTIEYTHNGNGYISNPGSTYQTVISSGPSIFPYITVLSPAQPPVVIDSQPTRVVAKTFSGNSVRPSTGRPSNPAGEIRLVYPAGASAPFTYMLNGTIYSIKPGYTQTITDDRPWSIEFLRGGNGSPSVRYDLTAGTYEFVADANGWDLRPYPRGGLPAATKTPAPAGLPPLTTTPAPVGSLPPLPALNPRPEPVPAPTPNP